MAMTTANDFTLNGRRAGKGVFGRFADRLIEARKRQADRVVAGYLLGLDDETLKNLGYDRQDLQKRDPSDYPSL